MKAIISGSIISLLSGLGYASPLTQKPFLQVTSQFASLAMAPIFQRNLQSDSLSGQQPTVTSAPKLDVKTTQKTTSIKANTSSSSVNNGEGQGQTTTKSTTKAGRFTIKSKTSTSTKATETGVAVGTATSSTTISGNNYKSEKTSDQTSSSKVEEASVTVAHSKGQAETSASRTVNITTTDATTLDNGTVVESKIKVEGDTSLQTNGNSSGSSILILSKSAGAGDIQPLGINGGAGNIGSSVAGTSVSADLSTANSTASGSTVTSQKVTPADNDPIINKATSTVTTKSKSSVSGEGCAESTVVSLDAAGSTGIGASTPPDAYTAGVLAGSASTTTVDLNSGTAETVAQVSSSQAASSDYQGKEIVDARLENGVSSSSTVEGQAKMTSDSSSTEITVVIADISPDVGNAVQSSSSYKVDKVIVTGENAGVTSVDQKQADLISYVDQGQNGSVQNYQTRRSYVSSQTNESSASNLSLTRESSSSASNNDEDNSKGKVSHEESSKVSVAGVSGSQVNSKISASSNTKVKANGPDDQSSIQATSNGQWEHKIKEGTSAVTQGEIQRNVEGTSSFNGGVGYYNSTDKATIRSVIAGEGDEDGVSVAILDLNTNATLSNANNTDSIETPYKLNATALDFAGKATAEVASEIDESIVTDNAPEK